MKRYIILFSFGSALLASIVILWVFSRNPKEVFSLADVGYSDIASIITVSGKIVTTHELEIKSRITADVSKIMVESGDRVRKNQVLMTLKTIPDISLLEDADAQVALAGIVLKQAEKDFDRAETLFGGRTISAKEYEASRNALLTAKEQYTLAINKRKIITTGESQRSPENDASTVLCPIDGIISEILVNEGETVTSGLSFPGTVLCRVADSGSLQFKGSVDEIDIAAIKEGMQARLILGALPKDTVLADIKSISSFGQTQNGYTQFEIKATLTSVPEGVQLRSGYSANAEIETERAEHALSVPEECIKFDKQLNPFVLRLISNPVDLRHQEWETVPVTLGISDGRMVQILSGLNEHDMIQLKITSSL